MPHKSTEQATLAAVEQLGYVQIDTIARVERAHHHTLWNRVKGYQPELLDKLQRKRKIFEHWYHAAAYRPIIQNVSLVSWSCEAYNEVAFSIRDVHE
ncbi:DNA glycosylase AlkZ-like family protein [Zooshikella harenae]|uniref:Winged helix DNA-binding domain-containing protein n=1 Tax=Zooshikella harenae TaxID=2827238 RepID=A0ABS5ZGH7_9GAMM|nr:crosslink repair DNA glycosylase YcaQ family protein [Zooshikella harenae]MBU2713167.1 winged helix DNA-binding domain-containing protein [Zooshikella harenae]